MSKNQFKKALRGVDSAIKQGTARALNRALSSAKTKMVRTLREETGLKTDKINSRVLEIKAKVDKPTAALAIATKVGVQLSEFNPKKKSVKVTHVGNKRPTRHDGVTVKIGKQSRTLVPGGWLATAKSGKNLVLARKGKAKYPTKALRTTVFRDVAIKARPEVQRHMRDTFDKNVSHEIEFAVSKKLKQNK